MSQELCKKENLSQDLEKDQKQYIIAINTKGFCKLHYKNKLRLESLKLFKNNLFIAPIHSRYLSVIKKCSNILTWTTTSEQNILKITRKIEKKRTLQKRIWASYPLNSPKKGFRQTDRRGYREYALFRKNYLDPMLYRKTRL